ncbi:outer membrane lipoprotein LolB [Alcaligenaceae bacterium]|nr:outer membrane lipoprotein LolB [Alcaligenaceae bacterium]
MAILRFFPCLPWSCRRPGAAAVLALALTLAGCAGPARIGGEGTAFERTGRFAVNVAEAGAPVEAVQGGFSWRDSGRGLRLDLVTPLGSTLARVTVDPSGAVLEQADGATERAPDADALLARVVGTPLPVSGLRDWLRGRPGAGEVLAMERDEQGRPLAFGQGGWQLRLSRYDALGPGLLRLERRDGSRQISVRLAVDAQPGE